MTKKKAIRVGHRGAVTKLILKIEEELQNSQGSDVLEGLCETLKKKRDILSKLDNDILEETTEEHMETEIEEADQYGIEIECVLAKVRNVNSKHVNKSGVYENLNPNAQEYVHMSGAPFRPVTSMSNHKLPKLNLPIFDGNLLNWQPFWDAFQSSIHDNSHITDVQKFSYLKNQLQGIAAQSIAGLPLTTNNYYQAVGILRERFGQTHKITNAYIQNLIQLPEPKSNLNSLRDFSDNMECSIRGLESLGIEESSLSTILTPIIYHKLPSEVRKNITRERGNDDWDLSALRCSITRELCVQSAGNSPNNQELEEDFVSTASFVTKTYSKQGNYQKSGKQLTCLYCEELHHPNSCQNVQDLEKRLEMVKKKTACFNCLGKHRVKDCKSQSRCQKCGKRHHTSICAGNSKRVPITTSKINAEPKSSVTENTAKPISVASLHSRASKSTPSVLLKTAIAPVRYGNICCDTNILLDEGAQRSFISQDVADRFNLKPTRTERISISGFGETATRTRQLNVAQISVIAEDGENIPINVLIVPEIGNPIKSCFRDISKLNHLTKLKLAMPLHGNDNFQIGILIGADHYWDIVGDDVIRGSGPTAVSSKLGYLLSGPTNTSNVDQDTFSVMKVLSIHKEEECDIEKFWNLESLGVKHEEDKSQMEDYLENYQNSSIYFENGRYVAKLPWKEDHEDLPTNEVITRKRTENVIKRLAKEPNLLKIYGEIISEQERRGFIERVTDEDDLGSKVHYIPHHPVKKDSTTTPIRIVYDCSCRQNRESPSLNDCLCSTPPVLNKLTGLLTRFRLRKYGISTDIEKAFLHVGLDKQDRDVTRFFWLSDPSDERSPLVTYRFKAILFGATCSPFILNTTLLKHLNSQNTEISENLQKNLYVDNILTSLDTEQNTMEYFKSSRQLLSAAGFNLRSWSSNCDTLCKEAEINNVLDTDEETKILGMRWNTRSDMLHFAQRQQTDEEQMLITKREILKKSSSIYDPLGILGPVTIRAKLLIQDLWKEEFEWDEEISGDMKTRWTKIIQDMESANSETKIPRCYFPEDEPEEETTLHIFVDASQRAYGACAYIVRGTHSTLVMAKNRVAPVKEMTLPRLELMAAVIGARLGNHLLDELGLNHAIYWSDSQIVLHWLKSEKLKNKFINNRKTEINNLTKDHPWKYVPTTSNPADLQTRGISAMEFQDNKLWLKGPEWITEKSHWPTWQSSQPTAIILSAVSTDVDCCNDEREFNQKPEVPNILKLIDVSRFSSYQRLLRVTAYVTRFIQNCKIGRVKRNKGHLSPDEMNEAAMNWISSIQQDVFHEEIKNLKSNKRNQLIKQLRLYLDDKGIIRCGGRIHNSTIPEEAKFPILLPSRHIFTHLLISDVHIRNFHSGCGGTITSVRQKFWIPSIRQVVRSITKKCVICRKVTGKAYKTPDPPPLPKDRLIDNVPFTVTGVDFTGAIHVKTSNNRNQKVYICLFTCASTRAVHLEVVKDLTEETFLLAFRRFISRKSIPKVMMSDNATTFVSAAQTIQRLTRSTHINDTLRQYGTCWKFIPKRAPWHGGYWERLIGLTKTCLQKVLGRSCINLDQFGTLVTEVELMLNDRPLTYVTSDIQDLEPLTPSHLLYGRRIKSLAYPDERDAITENIFPSHSKLNNEVSRKFEILNNFWMRWRNEYLTSLREYQRASGVQESRIRVGDIVQIHDETKRLFWKLGKVEELLTGKDGNVRSVTLRTNTGFTNRPITKLFPLELCVPDARRSDRLS